MNRGFRFFPDRHPLCPPRTRRNTAPGSPLLLLLSLLGGTALANQDPLPCGGKPAVETARSVVARRLEGPVRLDGILDEPDWQRPSAAPLIQNEPDNGCPPRQPTDWWVAYDDDALYVASRMHDSAPDSIEARLGRRDQFPPSDFFVLSLDTFNDDRTGYGFAVNAGGAIFDEVLYNDGWDDPSWDGVWDYCVNVDPGGWVVEIRIPFSQLNFPNRQDQIWGINVSRRTHRYQGRDELFHRPRDASGYISRFPDLVGIQGIEPGNRLELLAYSAGKAGFVEVDPDDPFRDGSEFHGDAGADLSWGLSSNLNLTATVNPDFGQVEVDPAVINLSDFETYFEERRPFFVKDNNIFNFGREGTQNNWNFNWMDPMPFYSRRVGRAPQVGLDGGDFMDAPQVTTILGATKLSGKIGNTSAGALSALTERETAVIQESDRRYRAVVEPRTSYNVVRIQNATPDGSRGLGLMGTGVFRDLGDEDSRTQLVGRAWSGGLDGWTRFADGVWAVRAYLSASRVSGHPDAIAAQQLSWRRYFQRPDVGHLAYDPDRTALSGWAGRILVNREQGNFRLNSGLGGVSPGYEINDLGFQFRADNINYHLAVGYQWSEPTRTFRWRVLDLATYHTWDFGGNRDNYGYGLFYWTQFTNYWEFGGSVFYNPERNSLRATRGGPAMRVPHFYEVNFNGGSDSRKMLSVYANWGFSAEGDGSAGGYASLSCNLRPASSLRVALGPEYSWRTNRTEWYANFQDDAEGAPDATRYMFSDLVYREFSLTTRVDWTFTPRMTLQTYLQPLFAAGDYSRLREFTEPGGFAFQVYGEDAGSTIVHDPMGDQSNPWRIHPGGTDPGYAFRLWDRDFNWKSLKVNLVFRWEYRPGSTLFLVWTQDRVNFENPGQLRLGRDVDSLLQSPGDDIFLMKVTHWLDL